MDANPLLSPHTESCPKSLSGQLGPGQDLRLGPTSQGRGRQPPSLVWVNKRMTAGAVPGPPERPALSQAAAHTAWRPMRRGSTRTHGNRGRGPRLTPGKAQHGQKSSGWTRQGVEIGRGPPVLRPPLRWIFCKELHGVGRPWWSSG